jgi:hypothetical protein
MMIKKDAPNTVLSSIIQDPKIAVSQLKVYLNNGVILYCDDVARFKKSPIPLFAWDSQGNIALYVTHFTTPDSKEYQEVNNLEDSGWGTLLTYIPETSIQNVELRIMET